MPKTSAERQAVWRERTTLKAALFDDLDEQRRERIRAAYAGDGRPEVCALIEFFARYPRCSEPPQAVNFRNGIWSVHLAREYDIEAAAAKIAMGEVTSLPVVVVGCSPPASTTERVRDEVAELRRLNLWDR